MPMFNRKTGTYLLPGMEKPQAVPHVLDGVKGTQWHAMGDHPAVVAAPPGLQLATNDKVEVNGKLHFVLVPVPAVLHRTGETGDVDDVVLPGYWVMENPAPDSTVWAISPEHLAAWFTPA
jgi:hypothetical protein